MALHRCEVAVPHVPQEARHALGCKPAATLSEAELRQQAIMLLMAGFDRAQRTSEAHGESGETPRSPCAQAHTIWLSENKRVVSLGEDQSTVCID